MNILGSEDSRTLLVHERVLVIFDKRLDLKGATRPIFGYIFILNKWWQVGAHVFCINFMCLPFGSSKVRDNCFELLTCRSNLIIIVVLESHRRSATHQHELIHVLLIDESCLALV